MSFGERPKRSRAPLYAVAALIIVGGIGFAVWSAGVVGAPPSITISAPDAVGPSGEVVVKVTEPVRGVVDVTVSVSGPGVDARTAAEVHHPAPPRAWSPAGPAEETLRFPIGKAVWPELREGTMTVTVTATAASSWARSPGPVSSSAEVKVMLTPPTVTPMSSFVHVAQGGAEAIIYEVGPSATLDGVIVQRKGEGEPWVFRGSPLPGGPPSRHFVLFAVPYDDDGPEADVKARVQLFAEDAVGNRSTAPFVHKFIPRPMPTDTITLKDGFLQKVTAEIFPQTPSLSRSGDLLADYLTLNRELRRSNAKALVALSDTKSASSFLWSQTFQPFDNASIKGAFADRRTYRYNDNVVDTQDHLGFDLARVERTAVNAGNDGVVVQAEYFGIYGNCIVIDHGFGLMSLYAHLSAMNVAVGDKVKRGDTIARTGATGLAGGDHLHFTMLLHGQAINPIEWWDGHWIKDRLKLKLGDALPWTE